MPELRIEKLRDDLRNYRIEPVYLLYGPEAYLRDIAARTITDRTFSDEDFRDFNDTEFSLNTSDNLRNALAAAEQLPMMARRRVIRVTEVRVTAGGPKDTLREDDEAVLAAYLQRPSESTVIIFVADELNGNRKMTKLLKSKAATVEFARLSGSELVKWVRGKIAEAGSEADEITVRMLIDKVGDDARRLAGEIAKLSAAALPETRITTALIDQLVPDTAGIDHFLLTEHICAGRKTEAVRILNKIFADGGEAIPLVGMISYAMRRMLIAKEMIERGMPPAAISSTIGGWKTNDLVAAARRSDIQKLRNAIQNIAKTDLALKTSIGGSGPKAARMQIEALVCELVSS